MVTIGEVVKDIVVAIFAMFSLDEGLLEECGGEWTSPDLSGLRRDFREELYGQHIASEVLPTLLQRHLFAGSSPLMLSFHGTSGVGKTLVSRMIAERLYKRGMRSNFVKVFNYQFVEDEDIYSWKLLNDIVLTARRCPQSLFVFDEADKMPAGVMNKLQWYRDQLPRSIFLFLSNSGSENIMQAVLDHRQNGRPRTSLTVEELTKHMSVMDHRVVPGSGSVNIVPFLPLEREHVRMCIRSNARSKGRRLYESLVEDIADELEYVPSGIAAFSSSGCKRVDEKVNLYARRSL